MKHRFGLFIHWGIYAQTHWQEQDMLRNRRLRRDYEPLASTFDPVRYDPDKWVTDAQAAGMEYICFTAKHHDGFCMWDTAETDYKITNTPYGRDVLKELSEACARHGMALSIYYSLPDAHNPNAYNERSSHQLPPEEGDTPDSAAYIGYVKRQITELMTNYGKIYTLFWDIPPKIDDPSVNELVRRLQPDILINDRGYSRGDFSTPERSVPEGDRFDGECEACESVGKESWGFRANEDYHTAAYLTSSMDRVFCMGGSYLLNVGPDEYGEFPTRAADLLRRCGSWYNGVRESFEGTIPCRDDAAGVWRKKYGCYVLQKENTLYLHFPRGVEQSGLCLAPCSRLPREAVLLPSGEEVRAELAVMPSTETAAGMPGPVLHLRDVPAEDYAGRPLVIRLRF